MFDFSRITDAISTVMASARTPETGQAGSVPELLGSLGIDPSMLDGLSQAEILGFLEQHGIDPALLPSEALQNLLQGTEIPQQAINLAQAWMEHGDR